MSAVEKKKLCWNCEGNVSRSTANCPYCGVYLHPEEEEIKPRPPHQEPAPPYRIEEEQESATIPRAPYISHEGAAASLSKTATYSHQEASPSEHGDGWKEIVAPLVFLLSGSIFLLFGILMLLFSNNGLFTLQWNANYWYLYFLVSLPLLYFGWRILESIEE